MTHDTIDMRNPAFHQDPYPLLRVLRERSRAERDVVGAWLVPHHADCNAGLRSSRLSREVWRMPGYAQMRPFIADSTLERTCEKWMLFNDPPVHTRLRRLAQGAFKPGVVAALRDRVAAIADQLLDAIPEQGDFDLMAAVAQPLPVQVICDILGLPADDFAQTKRWSDALALIIEPVIRRSERAAADRAAVEMVAYLREHIARHRASGERDDLLGRLIAAHDGFDEPSALGEDELLGNLILLFIAGHETTTNLIGNGCLALLRHPAQMTRLRAQPELMASAVDEMLRFESSVTMAPRHTVEPYAVCDVVVPADQTILFMIAAANRDPAVFADPDRFDIARSPNPQLAFGAGIHYCLGAPLAKLEAEVFFARLLQRHPLLELADATPHWRTLINLRGLQSLHLRTGGATVAPPRDMEQVQRASLR